MMGQRIKQMMKRKRLTIAALAAKAGVGQGVVGKLRRGDENVIYANLKAVAGALDTTVAYLTEGGWCERLWTLLKPRHTCPGPCKPIEVGVEVTAPAEATTVTDAPGFKSVYVVPPVEPPTAAEDA